MLAYRVSKANAHFIRTRLNGNAPPAPKQDTTYIIFPGGGIEPEVVTEPQVLRPLRDHYQNQQEVWQVCG